MNIAVFLSTVLPVVVMAVFSVKSPPQWLGEGRLLPHWAKINFFSALTGILLLTLAYFVLYADSIVSYRGLAALSVGVLTFLLGQTIFTDGFQRLADRRILRFANALSLVIGLWFLVSYGTQLLVMIYLLFALFATIIIFLPQIGSSDGRAIQLIVLSTLPVIGVEGFQIGVIAFLPIILLYGVIVSVKRRNFKDFFKKISVPMVPLMLAPFLAVVLVQPIL